MQNRSSFMHFLPSLVFTALAISAIQPAYAAHWTVDPAKSSLGFSGTQTGARFDGRFTKYNATIVFDPAHLETSHFAVTVDLASATTGDTQRDTALPGKDWFDIASFPSAQFTAAAIRAIGGNHYEATGTLNLRGVSQKVTLPFTLDITGKTAHAKGHADLLRNAYGVGQGPWSTGQWVALEVGVDIDIHATEAP